MKTKIFKICTSFLLFFALTLSAYAQQISGTVSDENGVPLPGATVVVEGTSTGVSTDFDGNYSIDASQGDILVFSYVGYQSQSVSVGASSTVDVSLEPDSLLDEVVVTALGLTRAKKSLGYSVSEISSEQVNTIKDHNLANALVGKVAGINITQSGTIGAGSRIVIRGNNSLTGQNQALVVVDGIPINQDGINSGGSEYNNIITGGGITDVNPNDVESVSILKGPNAAALYGARAGNGVILITTKKGNSESKMGVTVNSNTVFEDPMFLPDRQNIYGQGTRNAAATASADMSRGSYGQLADGSLQLYYDGTSKPYTAQPNNVADFYETGVKSINSVSISNGNSKSNFRFSYTNNSTTSILPNASLNSHNFNIRAMSQLTDKLSIDAKATYFTQELNHRARTGSEGITQLIHNMPTTVRVSDLRKYQMDNPATDADYAVIAYDRPGTSTGNPYWLLYNDVDDENRGRFFGFAKINYEFTDWLSGFVRVGADVTDMTSYFVRQPGHHYYPQGRLERTTSNSGELNSEFLLTAKGDVADDLNVVFNVGGNLSKRTYEAMRNFGDDFKLNSKAFLSNTLVQEFTETPQQIKKVNSLYASANFEYDNFAYLDVTARNDWSSTLGADNRSYMYTSVNLALLLQDYIDPNKELFDLFKVRASVANVGNDTSPYQLVQTFSVPGQGYLGLTTLNSPSTRLNPDLKPENIESTEVGLELSLLDNNLTFDFAYYNITTTDMIFSVPVPAATGYSFFLENVGEVTNQGVELLLGYNVINNSDMRWNTSLFASKNENKLVSLIDDLDTLVYYQTNSGNVNSQAKVGGGIGDLYGTVWERDSSGNRLVGADGKPTQSNPDNFLGNAQPDWLAGWSNSFFYKNFSLNVLIDGRFGGVVYSGDSSRLDSYGVSERSLQYRESGVVLDAVDPNGAANTVNITGQEYWQRIADIAEPYVYAQDNVRLRELAIGYSFPDVSALGMESINLQLIGRNLFFINKKAEDIDPEAALGTNLGGQGIALGNLPTLRSIGLNVTLKF
jgi:TonB-linked SusC/RagA family outer membrane protein